MTMRKLIKFYILIILFTGSPYGLSAGNLQDPPPPMMQTTDDSGTGSDCGETVDPGDGSPPPPPGLCLPINDYLLPLFLAGVALGAFQLARLNKKQEEFTNSIR